MKIHMISNLLDIVIEFISRFKSGKIILSIIFLLMILIFIVLIFINN